MENVENTAGTFCPNLADPTHSGVLLKYGQPSVNLLETGQPWPSAGPAKRERDKPAIPSDNSRCGARRPSSTQKIELNGAPETCAHRPRNTGSSMSGMAQRAAWAEVVATSSEREDRLHLWPELMDAATAARYVGEPSPRAFRRRVGKVYPHPIRIAGRGCIWRKKDLDTFIAALRGPPAAFNDLADVL